MKKLIIVVCILVIALITVILIKKHGAIIENYTFGENGRQKYDDAIYECMDRAGASDGVVNKCVSCYEVGRKFVYITTNDYYRSLYDDYYGNKTTKGQRELLQKAQWAWERYLVAEKNLIVSFWKEKVAAGHVCDISRCYYELDVMRMIELENYYRRQQSKVKNDNYEENLNDKIELLIEYCSCRDGYSEIIEKSQRLWEEYRISENNFVYSFYKDDMLKQQNRLNEIIANRIILLEILFGALNDGNLNT